MAGRRSDSTVSADRLAVTESLRTRIARAVDELAGTSVCLVGPAGMGKSHLVRSVLDDTAAASLRASADPAAMGQVTELLHRGVAGTGRIPGKHGGPARTYATVQVIIGDRPGELAKLFLVAEAAGVNIEDVRLEHAPGLPLGAADLSVQPEAVAVLSEALRAHGWHLP